MRDTLINLAGGGLIGTTITLIFQYLRERYTAKNQLIIETTSTASEERINYSSQLVAIHQKIVQAEHEWAQKEVELKVARFIAEEKLERSKEDCKREKREIHRLAEDQHVEIVELNAKLVQKDVEISDLEKQLSNLRGGMD